MRVSSLIAASLVWLTLLSASASALTYREALRIATEYDATIASLRQKVSRATTDIQSAKDGWLPSLSFAAETNNTATGGRRPW